MLKRIFLFLITNIAIILVITLVFAILENVFGFKLDLYGFNYISIIIYSLIVGFTGSFISLFISKWMAKKIYKIQLFNKTDYNGLNPKQQVILDIVENIASRNNIKMPEVGYYISNEANAFATGYSKNNSLLAVSSNLLDIMDKNAIKGVIGHEIAHIINGDMVTMTLLQGILNTFVIAISRIITNLIANSLDEEMGFFVYYILNIILQILFGFLATIILMKFSRVREFKADKDSAIFVGKQNMIAGLKTLQNTNNSLIDDQSSFASMKINNKNKKGFLNLFASHPNLNDRIKALENLSI